MNHDNPRAAARGRHRTPRRSLLAVLLALAALLALCTFSAGQPAAAASCRHISGPFHRFRNEILNSRGQRFVPYGITISNLGNPTGHVSREQTDVSGELSEIQDSLSWCPNSDRLQFLQDRLIDPRTLAVSTTFLSQLEQSVAAVRSAGLVAIVNDQSEGAIGGKTREVMPNKQTRRWWKVVATEYRNDPGVVFDIFNEPRHIAHSTSAQLWNRWRTGGCWWGSCWMGMEQLARYVHSIAPHNLLIVEGPETAGTLQGAPTHQITRAGPVLYSVNHGGPVTAPHDAAYWDVRFGNASRVIPVTDTEWTNYTTDTRMCWANAPRSVPAFLRYLAAHGMGLEAWTLSPGVLVTSSGAPTQIRSNWACRTGLDEGAGHQIMRWFELHNGS